MTDYVETNNYHNLLVTRNNNAESRTSLLAAVPDTVSESQYASERVSLANQDLANPPFKLTSNNNRLGGLANTGILRGYIRRSAIDTSDTTSQYRLYFMYNPETIQRNYMAYLDQQALDPYNTLYGSNNLSAPPGILDFSFDLMFDRQLEVASDPTHPGTKVDYDYFDRVVRGIIPDTPNSGNAIPDNGIMMVNPKNIAVIFSPDLAVHGRPYNSSVSFDKFNNQMTPVRLTISITMKAFYIGPIQTIPNFNQFNSEAIYAATIPYDETVTYQANYVDVQQALTTDGVNVGTSITNNYVSPYVLPNVLPVDDTIFTQSGAILSEDQMTDLVLKAGLRGDLAATVLAIAWRESRFNAGTTNLVPPDHSIGLFQINQLAHHEKYGTDEELLIPQNNMDAFMRLKQDAGGLSPWAINPDGTPYPGYDLKFLDRAKALVQVHGGY